MNYYSYESELLSALMTAGATPDVIEVIGKLEPKMFCTGAFRDMFIAVRDLYSKGLEFDFISIAEKTGIDLSGVTEMVKNSTGHASLVKFYGKKVRQGFYLRNARNEFSRAIKSIDECSDESMIGDIATQVESVVKNLVVETDDKKPRLAREILEQYVQIVDDRCNGAEEQRRLRVGIDAIDEKTHGFNLTDLIIVAGAPGMGKTELMMKLVTGASNEDQGALVFSMEMDEYQLIERSVAIEANLPLSCARSPLGMKDHEWGLFSNAMGVIKDKQFHVLDQAGLSADEIYAKSVDHKSRYPKTNLICIDYVGLIKTGKADRHDIAIGDISRRLKQLAKDIKTPVVLLAQITSKDVERRVNKRPLASDLKDSSRLQDDADWIIYPYREEVYDENTPSRGIAEVIFAKARHGSTGTVYMEWSNGHFSETDQAHASHLCTLKDEKQAPKKKRF